MTVFHRGTYTNPQLAAGLFVFLGAVLILGFLLPIAVPDRGSGLKMEFVNFTVFSEPLAPPMIKIMCVYPLIAGLAVTVVGAAARGVGRSIPVMLIGVLPVILLLADKTVRGGLAFMPSHFLGNGIAAFFALVGWAGLFGGGLALSYQRENRAAAVTAGIAGRGIPVAPVHSHQRHPGRHDPARGAIHDGNQAWGGVCPLRRF